MSSGGERLDNGVVELYSLDVGQADATVVISGEGQIILTDADEDNIEEGLETVLADRTIERTENDTVPLVFVATHFHRDHMEGLNTLDSDEYEISHVIQPPESRIEILDANTEIQKKGQGISENVMRDYYTGLDALGGENITRVARGDSVSIDSDADVSVLAPPDTDESVDVTRVATGAEVNLPPERPNENGAVYKLEGEQSALFMGDVQDKSDHYAESWLIQEHDDPESDIDLSADVLFVAHHGSDNATSKEFLDRVDPALAVISSDFAQRNNHPHDEVLKNLHEHDVAVYWTAGHGTTRVDLDRALSTDQTTDLDTANAADLAALKHYCREHELSPESVSMLAPGNLPEGTPDWVADTAPMVAQSPEVVVDAAIANADSIEEARQTLEATPDAHDRFRGIVQADRDEHVTTRADVKRNREAYFSAKDAERAYQRLPLHTRVRANLPKRFGGIDHPLEDVQDTDEMDGPRKFDEVPRAVSEPTAAQQRKRGRIPHDFGTAEKAADTAVEAAETSEELCQHLRETAGAHKDVLYAVDTPNAHEANKPDHDLDDLLNRANQQERTTERTKEQTHDQDRDMGLGL